MAKLITLGSLIDTTVDHYRHHLKELVGVSLWVIVGAAPFLFSGYIAPAGVDTATPMSETIAYLILNCFGVVTAALASFWISANLILTIDARAKGNTPDHVVLGKKSWKFVPMLFVFSILLTAALFAVAILAFIPGLTVIFFTNGSGAGAAALGALGVFLLFAGFLSALYLIVRYAVEIAFTQYFIVLETGSKFSLRAMWNAVQSSRKAVRGSWWAVALRLFIPNAIISLIVTAIALATNFSVAILVSFAAASLSALAIKLIAVGMTFSVFIINALVLPLYSLTTYYLYDSVKR